MDALQWSDVAALMGIPAGLSSVFASSFLWDGVKLLVLGSAIETGRRIFFWVMDRFRLRWSISAEFEAGDISQEWIVNYLIKENIWRTPRNVFVKTKNNKRKWKLPTGAENDRVDFIPEYGFVQFFRWRGYWLEVSRLKDRSDNQSSHPRGRVTPSAGHSGGQTPSTSISLTIFTLDRSILYAFVEECRLKYADHTRSEVTVYTADGNRRHHYLSGPGWTTVKMMRRRPLDSLLLDKNLIGSLLDDAREFLSVEEWYTEAGIPHRRGYLLHGPPGTGKTSTIYTLAGELGLEIYALSLSSKSLDDTRLAHLVSLLPTRGILVLEDIDCAFPSRDDGDKDEYNGKPWLSIQRKSQVTLSGLLNILDGIGSEEGKIFFATTNHIDRLDPALMRPGRIDRKVEYQLASEQQAHRLFLRFFPESTYQAAVSNAVDEPADVTEKQGGMTQLATDFASVIPPDEFSIAELQGYLLGCRTAPVEAIRGVQAWVERERQAQLDREIRDQLRKERKAAEKARQRRSDYGPVLASVQKAVRPQPWPTIPYHPGHGEPQPPGEQPRDAVAELGNPADQTGIDPVSHRHSDTTDDLNVTRDSSLNSVNLPSAEDIA